jgi:protein-L-isoaspartate(D-aspartate) O-methyltransferase
VIGSEVNASLADRARTNLSSYQNVSVHVGDGVSFDPGTCDAMLINAGITHPIPLWLDQLKENGRIVIPLTMAVDATRGVGLMVRIARERGQFSMRIASTVAIYSCVSARDAQRESLLKAAMTNGSLMKMKSLRRDLHEQSETCIVHASDVCISAAELL